MLITDDILSTTERDVVGNIDSPGFENWFFENEPVFVEWCRKRASTAAMIPGVAMPPQIVGAVAERILSAFLIGYMVAAISNAKQYGDGDIASYMSSYTKDPEELYALWQNGELDSKFYNEAVLGEAIVGAIPNEVKVAIENHKKVTGKVDASNAKFALVKMLNEPGEVEI